jgi:hypothetical protein
VKKGGAKSTFWNQFLAPPFLKVEDKVDKNGLKPTHYDKSYVF